MTRLNREHGSLGRIALLSLLMQAAVLSLLIALPSTSDAVTSCEVLFRLSTNVAVGNMQWMTDYSGASGEFVGAGTTPDCTFLAPGALAAAFDDDAAKVLTVGILSLSGLNGIVDLVRCEFESNVTPAKADFELTIDQLGDINGQELFPRPSLTIHSIQCTTEVVCGDGVVDSGEECDDGNASSTDACLPGCVLADCGDGLVRTGVEECDDGNNADDDACSMDCERQRPCGDATGDGNIFASDSLRILQKAVGQDVDCPRWVCDVDGLNGVATSDALRMLRKSVDIPTTLACGDPTAIVLRITSTASLGSLQLNLGYTRVQGEIDGAGSTVLCHPLQNDVQSAFNDKPERTLAASFVSLSGIVGPAKLMECDFTTEHSVEAADFDISVLDVRDRNGNTVLKPALKIELD